jgi:hypothetical protein
MYSSHLILFTFVSINVQSVSRARSKALSIRQVIYKVKQNDRVLWFVYPESRNYRKFILAAVSQNDIMLKFTLPELKGGKDVVLTR